MIDFGFIILNNGRWQEIDFADQTHHFSGHEEFARDYLNSNKEAFSNFQDCDREYSKQAFSFGKSQEYNPVDFLCEYYGFIKIGNKIGNLTSKTILAYPEPPEYTETNIGKERTSIINLYYARGFQKATIILDETNEYMYRMQKENGLFKKLKDYEKQDTMEKL